VFERNDVTFVSVTQAFNTTNSMGRLTLNILLSFAQFEREVSSERIRDKIAASRKRGIFMGGWVPLGYDVKDRKLIVNDAEAAIVRRIFKRFVQCGSALTIVRELASDNVVNKYGKKLDKGAIYHFLRNRTYIGDAVHKGVAYHGEHEGLIPKKLFDKVQAILDENATTRRGKNRSRTPALLRGLIFGPSGRAMSPHHTRKRGKLYRYYVDQAVFKHGAEASPVGRVPAGRIEAVVIDQLRTILASPEIIVATWRSARTTIKDLKEADVRAALERLNPLWDELFPAEQARIIHLLVERVDVSPDGLDIKLKIDGLTHLAGDLTAGETQSREAA